MKATLPETVPVLTAQKMHRRSSDGPNGTHCLMGWAWTAAGFPETSYMEARENIHRLESAVAAEIRKRTGNGWIPNFNDDPLNPKRVLADVWNAAMKRLGYRKRGNQFILPKKTSN